MELDFLSKGIIKDVGKMVGGDFKGNVYFKKDMLCYRIYGEFDKNSGDIYIAEELPKINFAGYVNVLKHELVHAIMWQQGYRAYDDTSKFEKVLRKMGCITNGNYPLAEEVALGHTRGRIAHCYYCREPLCDIIGEGLKTPENAYCKCAKSLGRPSHFIIGDEQDIVYKTYQYRIYDSVRNEFSLNGELPTLSKYYFDLNMRF